LVQKEPQLHQEQRFKLLETLREYALEQLRMQGELAASRRWHAQYFCRLAEIADPLLRGPDEILWLDRLEADHDNLRAATAWSLDSAQDIETGLRLVGMLWWFWYMRGYMREGLDWLRYALAKEGGNFPTLRAKILQGACSFTWANHAYADKRELRALIEETIKLYRQLDDPWNLAKSLGDLGFVIERLDEFAAAAEEAKQLFRQVNDPWGLAWISVMEFYVAPPNAQQIVLEESVLSMRALGAKFGLALALLAATQKARFRSDYEQARTYVEESIALFHKMGEKWTLANALFSFSEILIAQNQPEGLAEIYAEGIRVAQQSGSSELEAQFRQCQEWLMHQPST
jgi:hypothetical protein